MKLVELSRLEDTLCASAPVDDGLFGAGVNRHQEEFLRTLAEELQYPLNNMRNALRIWRSSEGDYATRGYAAGIVERQLREAIGLIDDLVELERIGGGRIEVQQSCVDLTRILTDVVRHLSPELLSARQTTALNLPDDRLYVRGDATRLARILAALIAHSARFADDDDVIDLTLRRAANHAELRIVNHAAGIAPPVSLSSFRSSSLLANERADLRLDGHVGLVLARRLAELQGGTVEVRDNGGCADREVSVRLPLLQESDAAQRASPAVRDAAERHVTNRTYGAQSGDDAKESS